jgi:hypothetical protein
MAEKNKTNRKVETNVINGIRKHIKEAAVILSSLLLFAVLRAAERGDAGRV